MTDTRGLEETMGVELTGVADAIQSLEKTLIALHLCRAAEGSDDGQAVARFIRMREVVGDKVNEHLF